MVAVRAPLARGGDGGLQREKNEGEKERGRWMAVCGSARSCHPYLYAGSILTQPAIDHGAPGQWGQRAAAAKGRILRKREGGGERRAASVLLRSSFPLVPEARIFPCDPLPLTHFLPQPFPHIIATPLTQYHADAVSPIIGSSHSPLAP